MPRLGVLEVCSSISPPGQKRHRSFVEDGLVLATIGRRVKINLSFENFEGQDEISSEASAFQREEVELAKPFLIWHVTEVLQGSGLSLHSGGICYIGL